MAATKSLIKDYLDARGLKYRWFARQLGISEGHFNHIEAGRRRAPAGYYERCAQLLGVPPGTFSAPAPASPEPVAV